MHRRGPAILGLLACLLGGLAGCAIGEPKASPVRRIFVEEAVGAPTPALAGSAAVIHDTSVRTLRALGYADAREPGEADASLRATWFVRPSSAGDLAGPVALRLTLVDRDGNLLRAVEVVESHAGFLTAERIADSIRAKLGRLLP